MSLLFRKSGFRRPGLKIPGFERFRFQQLGLAGLLFLLPAFVYGINYSDRPEVRAFAEKLSEEEGFQLEELIQVLAQGEYKQSIIDAISRPAEKTLEWNKYQDLFVNRSRVKGGREFSKRYRKVLKRAEEAYSVPSEIIVAIIGIETKYGKVKGKYRVLDALMTLGFDYPPRSRFFRKELKEFLLLAREENMDVDSLLGSYAGAMGYGQFIPSSYRFYAVDFDGDDEKDIWNNPIDGIGSVANYLSKHGWKYDGQIIERAFNVTEPVQGIFADALKPGISYEDIKARAIRTKTRFSGDELVSPLLFNGKKGPEYWIGLNNFYVITRYNPSKLYAMAVYQLSQRISGSNLR